MATVIRRRSPISVGLNYQIGGGRGKDNLAEQRKEYNKQLINILRSYQHDKDMIEKPTIYRDIKLPDIEKAEFRTTPELKSGTSDKELLENGILYHGNVDFSKGEMTLPKEKTVKRNIEVFKQGEGNRPRKRMPSYQKKALDDKYQAMAEIAGSAFDKRVRIDTDKLFGDEIKKTAARRSGTRKFFFHPDKGYIEGFENLQRYLKKHPEEVSEWKSERLLGDQLRSAGKVGAKPWAYGDDAASAAKEVLRNTFEGDQPMKVGRRAFGMNLVIPDKGKKQNQKQKKEKGVTYLSSSEYEELARKYYYQALEKEVKVSREKANDKQREKAKAIARWRLKKNNIKEK